MWHFYNFLETVFKVHILLRLKGGISIEIETKTIFVRIFATWQNIGYWQLMCSPYFENTLVH